MARKWDMARRSAVGDFGVTVEGSEGVVVFDSDCCLKFDVNEGRVWRSMFVLLGRKAVGRTKWSFRWLLDGVEAGGGGALVVGGGSGGP